MLSIQPLKSAKGAADYYSATFNYYAGDAESMVWCGKGSEYLKLSGTIDKEMMLSLLEGHLPNGVVVQSQNGVHRPGFDMTFSAPKSVSILVGLGIAPELLAFHDKAVKFAIQQIEQEFAEARKTQQGETTFEKTGNLVIAAFRQPTSRANDPALHTHCVTINITKCGDSWRALSSDATRTNGVIEQIQNNAHYCGLLYRQHLANQLKEANFELRLSGNGLFEIENVPEEILQEFSRRRGDIKQHMEEKGWMGAKSASAATLLTRSNKEEHDLELLKEEWQERASALGFEAKTWERPSIQRADNLSWYERFIEKLARVLRFPDMPVEKGRVVSPATACVEVAMETVSQRTSVFSERTLLTEAMKHSLVCPETVTHKELAGAIAIKKKEQSLYEAICPESQKVMLTTPWLLTVEAETLARIENNKGLVSAIATHEAVINFQKMRANSRVFPMTGSQLEAMKVLLTSNDRFLAIQGYAGVAKTSMLAEAKHLIEEKGYQLRGITVASSAAHELQKKAGISADVFPLVHQELKSARTGTLHKTVFIADEASMLSSYQGHELIKQVERVGARLVLVGDKAQLPSVNTGRIFSLTQEYGIETAEMKEIVRQKNTELKEAVLLTTQGSVREAVAKLNVKALNTHQERVQWIAEQWLSLDAKRREETLLFAPTHANREAITSIIRTQLQAEGTLSQATYSQDSLRAKSIEAIQQRFVTYYQSGNVVRINKDFKRYQINEGEYFTVANVRKEHRQNNVLPLIDKEGKQFNFPLNNLPQYKTHTGPFERVIELYTRKELELRVGDKVMWLRNFKKDGIRNGQCAHLLGIEDNHLSFKTKEDNILRIEKSHPSLQHLDYSYVLTNYKVQGKDAPYGIGLMESYHRFSATIKNFYVQISRAVHGMTLITDNKEELINALRKNHDEKPAALDITTSKALKQHEERFSHHSQISLGSIIEKKLQIDREQRSLTYSSNNSLKNELMFNQENLKNTREISKELEL